MRQRTHLVCSGSVLISRFLFRGKVWRVCYEQICIHLKFMCLSSYPLVPQNVTVFGDRVFKRIVKWNEFVRVGSDLVWWVSYKNRLGNGHPEKDREEKLGKPIRVASEGTNPADTLTLDLEPAELWENKCVLFKATSLRHFVVATGN